MNGKAFEGTHASPKATDNWAVICPKGQQQSVGEVPGKSGNRPSKLQGHSPSRIERASSKRALSPRDSLPGMRSYAVEFRIGYNDLEIRDKVGDGGYGSVFKGVWKTGHVLCAVKMLNRTEDADNSSDEGLDPSDEEGSALGGPRDDFERETALLRELHHPNLVVCYGMCPGGPGVP